MKTRCSNSKDLDYLFILEVQPKKYMIRIGGVLTAMFFFCGFTSFGQIPNNAKAIIVKGVSFIEVCNALLDSGYTIEKKDNELQTATTDEKMYPKSWNAKFKINVRVKDSIGYFTATFSSASTTLFKDDPVEYLSKNQKGISSFPFLWINDFAKGFNKEIEYK